MSKRFEECFSEPFRFEPEGVFLGRFIPKEEALVLFKEDQEAYYGESELELKDIKESYVRFQPSPYELRAEGVADMAWIVCQKNDRNSQPCWEI